MATSGTGPTAAERDYGRIALEAYDEADRSTYLKGPASVDQWSHAAEAVIAAYLADHAADPGATVDGDREHLAAVALDNARCLLTRGYAANDPEIREIVRTVLRAVDADSGARCDRVARLERAVMTPRWRTVCAQPSGGGGAGGN